MDDKKQKHGFFSGVRTWDYSFFNQYRVRDPATPFKIPECPKCQLLEIGRALSKRLFLYFKNAHDPIDRAFDIFGDDFSSRFTFESEPSTPF